MIQWETFITDVDRSTGRSTGRISLHRVRKLLELVFACAGVAIAAVATLIEVLTRVEVPTDMVLILVGACVIPITGGQISDAVFGSRLSRRIQDGGVPGRRRDDTGGHAGTEG